MPQFPLPSVLSTTYRFANTSFCRSSGITAEPLALLPMAADNVAGNGMLHIVSNHMDSCNDTRKVQNQLLYAFNLHRVLCSHHYVQKSYNKTKFILWPLLHSALNKMAPGSSKNWFTLLGLMFSVYYNFFFDILRQSLSLDWIHRVHANCGAGAVKREQNTENLWPVRMVRPMQYFVGQVFDAEIYIPVVTAD